MREKHSSSPDISRIRVLPVDGKDRIKPVNLIRSLLFLAVPAAVNSVLLRSSLEELIRDHLPILGARLLENKKTGQLEYHLPETFGDDYNLFDWSMGERGDTTLQEAGFLPASTPSHARPSFGSLSVPALEASVIPSGWPLDRTREKPDCPLLLVHIVRFKDGAVVCLNIPHTVCDQLGYGSFIRAWLQVAAGQKPTPFIDLPPGELDGDASLPLEELRTKGRLRLWSKTEKLASILTITPGLIVHRESRKLMFFPTNVLDGLRDKFNKRLMEMGENFLVTNGDVLASLLVKLEHLTRKRAKRVTFTTVLNARGRHASLPLEKPYLHNAITFAAFRHSIDRHTPLFDLTALHRQAVIEGLKPKSAVRDLTVLHETAIREQTLFFGEPCETSFNVSNWCGAWRGIDFAPVTSTTSTGSSTAAHEAAQQVLPMIYGHSLLRGRPARFNTMIQCKAYGGYWCDFSATRKDMAAVEVLFDQDPWLQSL